MTNLLIFTEILNLVALIYVIAKCFSFFKRWHSHKLITEKDRQHSGQHIAPVGMIFGFALFGLFYRIMRITAFYILPQNVNKIYLLLDSVCNIGILFLISSCVWMIEHFAEEEGGHFDYVKDRV